MAKISVDNKNWYYVTAEKEDLSFDVDITTQPVERSIDVSDHVQRKARSLSISGAVVGTNAAEVHQFLVETESAGKLVYYSGRTSFRGLLYGLQTSRDYTIADGFTLSVSIQEVIFASTSYVADLPLPVKAQAAKIVNSGIKQTKSKGTASKKNQPAQKVKFMKGSPWAEEK